MRSRHQLKVLVVEDSTQDAFLIKSAFGRTSLNVALTIVKDGVEAVRFLRGEGKYRERRTADHFPDFIISDVKMPGMDGFQFLRWVRSHADASHVPIIFLSSAGTGVDAEQAYRLGANAFLVKPDTLEELTEMIRATCDFWSRCKRPEVASVSRVPVLQANRGSIALR